MKPGPAGGGIQAAQLDSTEAKESFSTVRTVAGSGVTLLALGWATDSYSRLGMAIYSEQLLATILGLTLVLMFLPRGKMIPGDSLSRRRLNVFAAAVSFGCSIYLAAFYPELIAGQLDVPLDALMISCVLFLAVLEGLRRMVGWTLVTVILLIIGYALIGHTMSGPLQTRAVSPEHLVVYLGLDSNAMLGITLSVAATVVIAFVFFGQLLMRSGGTEFFNELALALMGRSRGGSAKISVVASGLFGSISGVVVSNILATGVITIRMMKRGGFKAHTAAAIEAVASTGGQIMPPVMGAVAFLMADFLQIPYTEVVAAAFIPALLYYIALFFQIDFEAVKQGIGRVDPKIIPAGREVLREGWIFALPFVALIGALFFLDARPETAALYGSIGAIVAGMLSGYKNQRMRVRDLLTAVSQTGQGVVDVVIIAAAAGFIIGTLNITGLGFGLTYMLVQLGQNSLLVLLSISAMVCIVLGMGMPTVGVYLLLAILVAPSLVEVGVDPIASHLFIFYLGMMSMVTPPMAIGSFFAASIAEAAPMKTAFTSMRLGWTAYVVPFLFIISPALLMKGGGISIVAAVATAIAGIWCISVGLVGNSASGRSDTCGVVVRVLFVLAGALLLVPGDSVDAGYWSNMAGAAIAGLLIGYRWLIVNRDRTAASYRIGKAESPK